ncbi:MAG: tRNA pseudouridine(55) synthase TruB [Sphingobacteriaceae bacterium]|nr:tRNA pseudouridine(55) synthase TruB [Sphingobacteriaceae bacterium]
MLDFQKGEVLLFDKPLGWTSFDLVKKVRNLIRIKKVGHAGTLDPLATGLMILCTGAMTKSIERLTGMDKTYTGTLRLGETTPSYDRETEVNATFPYEHITAEQLHRIAATFTGDLMQIPPAHSAIKVDGKRLYVDARKGIEVEIKPRPVHVHSFEITAVQLPDVQFSVKCSKGTYIRSLVFDFGKALESGAVMTELCRTSIGEYALEGAWQLTDFENMIKAQRAAQDEGLPRT